MLHTIGGKIAPRPSLPSNRASIQRRQAWIARGLSGVSPTASQAFMTRSMPRKKQAQAVVSEGGGGPRRSRSVKSSAMPRPDGRRRSGLKDHISESGTIIVRDQADTRDRFTGNHVGNSTASGGTAGQAE